MQRLPDQRQRRRRRGAQEPSAPRCAPLCAAERFAGLSGARAAGIGSFTIVDGATVCDADLGNNFFVEQAAVGTSRAACVTKLLQELNEHVAGSYVSDDIGVVLDSRPDYLAPFSLVIATQLPGKDAAHVAAACAAASVPLLIAHAYGLLGYLRLVLPEHAVTEAHPDHALPDLRLLKPPAALRELVATRFADLDSLDSAEYAHVPFVVLLLRAVDTWSAANGGALPTTYAQKKELRAIVASYRRPAMQADQNIDEALSALNTALSGLVDVDCISKSVCR